MTDYLVIERRGTLFYLVYDDGYTMPCIPRHGMECSGCQRSIVGASDGDVWHSSRTISFCPRCFSYSMEKK